MNNTVSIRPIALTFSLWSAAAFLLGNACANAEQTNRVVSHGNSFELKATFEGTPTSYTRRGKDPFSVGYYVKDGAIVQPHSLLADESRPVSKLDLDVVASGEGFQLGNCDGQRDRFHLDRLHLGIGQRSREETPPIFQAWGHRSSLPITRM